MPKNIIQDIVPPSKRSIRNIPLINRKRNSILPPPPPVEEPRPPKKSAFGKVFIGLAMLLVLVFTFFLMNAFSSADVSVTPKRESVTFSIPVKISKTDSSADLRYEVIQVKKQTEQEAKTNGEEMAEKKASGKITIYNNFSSDSQRLIARTRFQAADGLIYRINDSVTVPGTSVVNGKTQPGTLEVTVYADEAGDKYNVGPTEFTVPGFKDDAKRFAAIYAKSSAAFTGGFIGKVKKVSDSDRQAAVASMKDSLTVDLNKEIASQMPDDLVSLNGSVIYQFADLPDLAKGDSAFLEEEGTAQVIVLEKENIASLIAKDYLQSWGEVKAQVESFDQVSVKFDKTPDLNSNLISAVISGQAPMVAAVDETAVAAALAGKPKSDFDTILAGFPSVVSAKVMVKPVWEGSFPSDSSKIHISIAPVQ